MHSVSVITPLMRPMACASAGWNMAPGEYAGGVLLDVGSAGFHVLVELCDVVGKIFFQQSVIPFEGHAVVEVFIGALVGVDRDNRVAFLLHFSCVVYDLVKTAY